MRRAMRRSMRLRHMGSSRRLETPRETRQRLGVVDIAPYGQGDELEAELGRTCNGLAEDALGAPVDILEEAPMRPRDAENVIAAIICGPDDHAIAPARELGCDTHQITGR